MPSEDERFDDDHLSDKEEEYTNNMLELSYSEINFNKKNTVLNMLELWEKHKRVDLPIPSSLQDEIDQYLNIRLYYERGKYKKKSYKKFMKRELLKLKCRIEYQKAIESASAKGRSECSESSRVIKAIAKRIGKDERTVRNWINEPRKKLKKS